MMVVLDINLIKKSSSSHLLVRKYDPTSNTFLKRATHLYLNNKKISKIDSLENCPRLTTLYLYENQITKIENLDFLKNLTALYLQNNNIQRLENLSCLYNLKKLFLARNAIGRVEGLEGLHSLQELHIESQKLPEGTGLYLNPLSLKAVSKSLQILYISNNRIVNIIRLKELTYLNQLFAKSCHIKDVWQVITACKELKFLRDLDMSGNDMCSKHRYKERLIAYLPLIDILDGKVIHQSTKIFMKSWLTDKKPKVEKEKRVSFQKSDEASKLGDDPPLLDIRSRSLCPLPPLVFPSKAQLSKD